MKINMYITSDIHGYIYPYDYSKETYLDHSLAHVYDCFENDKTKNKILIDNGDIIQGNSAELFIDEFPNSTVKIMNAMGYSLWNMGNHEFNFSFPRLKKIISEFDGTALMANSNSSFFTKYKTINFEGVKVSFIGIDTVLINTFEKEQSLCGLVVEDPVNILNILLEELKNNSDIIVGLFHVGLKDENSVENSGIYSILKNIEHPELFDVIVAGHTHVEIKELFYNNTLITQPGAYAKTVSKIELEFDKELISKKSSLINLKDYKPSEKILNLYKPYHDRILKYDQEIIGFISGIDKPFNQEFEDTPLNHLITSIMLKFSNADVVAFSVDTKENLKNGPLSRGEFSKLYSYSGGEVTTYEITGLDLKKYVNWSYDYFNSDGSVNEVRANFKYKTLDIFGNINYTINLSKEDKIVSLKYLDGKDIKDNDTLIIGMNEYRMNFLVSEKGPLAGREFLKLNSSKYIDESLEKRGTIKELAVNYFKELNHNTFEYNQISNFKICKL